MPQGGSVTVDGGMPRCHNERMGKQKTKNSTNIYLSAEIHKRLRMASAETGVSASIIVERLLERHLASFVSEPRSDQGQR